MIISSTSPINGFSNIIQEKLLTQDRKQTVILRPYVLQLHRSDRAGEHFDFRIMKLRSNKLQSWALPKATVPRRPNEKNLAVRTKDHDPIWLSFEGRIPEGEYGSGRVKIAQKGELEIIKWTPRSISFSVTGKIMNGKYSLVKLNKPSHSQEEWLIIKRRD